MESLKWDRTPTEDETISAEEHSKGSKFQFNCHVAFAFSVLGT